MENSKDTKLSFLHDEMTEARLFKNPKQFITKNEDDIAVNIFAHLLGLQIIRYSDTKKAKSYAKETLKFNGFDKVRPGATDLHNLIAGLERKKTYNIPLDIIKKYLGNIKNNIKDESLDRRLFMFSERALKIEDVNLKSLRRVISDWSQTSFNDRKMSSAKLKFLLNHYAKGSDLTLSFNKSISEDMEEMQ